METETEEMWYKETLAFWSSLLVERLRETVRGLCLCQCRPLGQGLSLTLFSLLRVQTLLRSLSLSFSASFVSVSQKDRDRERMGKALSCELWTVLVREVHPSVSMTMQRLVTDSSLTRDKEAQVSTSAVYFTSFLCFI